MSKIVRKMNFKLFGTFNFAALIALLGILAGPCGATSPGGDPGYDPELAAKAAIAREKAKPATDLGRYFLKEVMRDGDTPTLALILDTRSMKESFYLTGSFVGPFVIDRVMSESVILKESDSGELFYLKVNTPTMEKIKSVSSDSETVDTDATAAVSTSAVESSDTSAAAEDFDPLGDFDSLNLAGKSQKTIRKKLRAIRSGAYVKGASDGSDADGSEAMPADENAVPGEDDGGGAGNGTPPEKVGGTETSAPKGGDDSGAIDFNLD